MNALHERIRDLCTAKNAVILAHNYTLPEVQDVADFTGDSLELALRGRRVEADLIVFCGVHFMAETVKILNPSRTVLMPDTRAGCPMADMVTAGALREARAKHPDHAVVSYVNTSAEVKAESDICCTSGNAVQVVAGFPRERPILFLPDRNLGSWVQEQLKRPMTLWNGFCPTHERILPAQINEVRAAHPKALLVAHPECPAAVRALADHIASTSGILAFCKNSPHHEFIIATEHGLLHRLRKESPDKVFHEAGPRMTCPNMKRTTLEKILWCLEDGTGAIEVAPAIADRARGAIERMLEVVPPRPAAPPHA